MGVRLSPFAQLGLRDGAPELPGVVPKLTRLGKEKSLAVLSRDALSFALGGEPGGELSREAGAERVCDTRWNAAL